MRALESDLARHLQSQSETKQKDKINLRKRKLQRKQILERILDSSKMTKGWNREKPMAKEEEDRGEERVRNSHLSPFASSNYRSRSENAFRCLYQRQRDSWRQRNSKRKKKGSVSESE